MRITRFPGRERGVSERMTGFMAHLRSNGVNVGVAETEAALEAMTVINSADRNETYLALKSICANDADRFMRFEELFKSYWYNSGREKQRSYKPDDKPFSESRWTNRSVLEDTIEGSSVGSQDLPEDGSDEGEADQAGEGKLIASGVYNFHKTDLREFMKPEDMALAEKTAEKIAKSIRDRRSRRRRAKHNGPYLDLRRIARKSVESGGEPIALFKRQRPERPIHLAVLLDVSGSMKVYARVFLAFLKGLVSVDQRTDAYLFHTRLVRISDALRDRDTFRAVNKLSMMAQGFGGGTKIGKNLMRFNQQYAANSVNGRSVVVILSDGYDTDPPEQISSALARLKKRGCKVIWLNPLKGWKGYQPVAKGMAAAMPHLDLFASANTLESLAALEPHLEKI